MAANVEKLNSLGTYTPRPNCASPDIATQETAYLVAPAEVSATKMRNSSFIRDYFRHWLAHFKLSAHFLDLRGLLFELRNHALHIAF